AEGCEKGNFPVLNAQTQELDYIAHHYSEEELVKLLLKSGFNIKKFCYRTFTTRSGSKINGMVVIAEKKS
ncbi:MAG: SAM-dependent methyltransferase, partial [archaeon]|nr:SAM-dependent methyltransferase [archaeon]